MLRLPEISLASVTVPSGLRDIRSLPYTQTMRTAKRAILTALFLAGSVWGDYCGIEPIGIRPIPPIGCNDLVHRCICTASGQCFWTWVCV